jgi:hypothetical protein
MGYVSALCGRGKPMDRMMGEMGWMHGAGILLGILLLVVLFLGAAALVRYLRTPKP